MPNIVLAGFFSASLPVGGSVPLRGACGPPAAIGMPTIVRPILPRAGPASPAFVERVPSSGRAGSGLSGGITGGISPLSPFMVDLSGSLGLASRLPLAAGSDGAGSDGAADGGCAGAISPIIMSAEPISVRFGTPPPTPPPPPLLSLAAGAGLLSGLAGSGLASGAG